MTAFWIDIDWDAVPLKADGRPEPFWMHLKRKRDVIDVRPKAPTKPAFNPYADMARNQLASMGQQVGLQNHAYLQQGLSASFLPGAITRLF